MYFFFNIQGHVINFRTRKKPVFGLQYL